jgi:hypothetical protein
MDDPLLSSIKNVSWRFHVLRGAGHLNRLARLGSVLEHETRKKLFMASKTYRTVGGAILRMLTTLFGRCRVAYCRAERYEVTGKMTRNC